MKYWQIQIPKDENKSQLSRAIYYPYPFPWDKDKDKDKDRDKYI